MRRMFLFRWGSAVEIPRGEGWLAPHWNRVAGGSGQDKKAGGWVSYDRARAGLLAAAAVQGKLRATHLAKLPSLRARRDWMQASRSKDRRTPGPRWPHSVDDPALPACWRTFARSWLAQPMRSLIGRPARVPPPPGQTSARPCASWQLLPGCLRRSATDNEKNNKKAKTDQQLVRAVHRARAPAQSDCDE